MDPLRQVSMILFEIKLEIIGQLEHFTTKVKQLCIIKRDCVDFESVYDEVFDRLQIFAMQTKNANIACNCNANDERKSSFS